MFGHSLNRAVQAEVSRILFAELQPVYVLSGQTAASRNVASLSQNWALQLLLDIKVLSELLQGDAAETGAALEAHVDPFDLDVVTPHLEKRAAMAAQQASLLLGLSLSPQRFACERFPPGQAVPPAGHNVLPLHATSSRFPLLPTLSRFLEQPELRVTESTDPPAKCASGPDLTKSAQSLTASQSTPVLSASLSFYEKMATTVRTSWFGAQ